MEEYKALLETLGGMTARTTDEKSSGADAALRMTEPDPDMDEQPLQWSPELSLMLAILEDAIACYRKALKRPRQNPDILARQAEFWVRLDDWDSPFSFNNICEALRLDPVATRERILASRIDRRTAA